ncbi:MAG: DUF6745 domain-containing protein [Ktedonobacteraceae bacterium]
MPTMLLSVPEARELLLRGEAPAGLTVRGHLDFSREIDLVTLPDHLTVTHLTLDGCVSLKALPPGLHCYELSLRDTQLTTLPADLQVEYRLDLSNCDRLEELPQGLTVGSLVLGDCVSLRRLPEGMDVSFLDLTGCINLTAFPIQGSISFGRLNARGCLRLHALPDWLTRVAELDISNCTNLTALPPNLHVTSFLDIGNTPLTSLPASLSGVQLRWHAVAITPRIAFQPETISAQEALGEQNTELRRVLIERMGHEKFIEQAAPYQLDQDDDPGGERRLLRIDLSDDEPLVALAVQCPSTGRRYLIRVPPAMQTCRQAAAWIAGFDDPDLYQPVAET